MTAGKIRSEKFELIFSNQSGWRTDGHNFIDINLSEINMIQYIKGS